MRELAEARRGGPRRAAADRFVGRARRLARPRRGEPSGRSRRWRRSPASRRRCSSRRPRTAPATRAEPRDARRRGREDRGLGSPTTTTCGRSRSPTATGSTTSTTPRRSSAPASSSRCAPTARRSGRSASFTRSLAHRQISDEEIDELERLAFQAGPALENARRLRRGARARRPRRADRPPQPPVLPRDARARGRPRAALRAAAGRDRLRPRRLQGDQRPHRPPGRRRRARRGRRAAAARRRATADIACRVGGDEFAVIAAGVDVEDAELLAGRIAQRDRQRARSATPGRCSSRPASRSFGPSDQPDDLFKRADDALYRAKGSARPAPSRSTARSRADSAQARGTAASRSGRRSPGCGGWSCWQVRRGSDWFWRRRSQTANAASFCCATNAARTRGRGLRERERAERRRLAERRHLDAVDRRAPCRSRGRTGAPAPAPLIATPELAFPSQRRRAPTRARAARLAGRIRVDTTARSCVPVGAAHAQRRLDRVAAQLVGEDQPCERRCRLRARERGEVRGAAAAEVVEDRVALGHGDGSGRRAVARLTSTACWNAAE